MTIIITIQIRNKQTNKNSNKKWITITKIMKTENEKKIVHFVSLVCTRMKKSNKIKYANVQCSWCSLFGHVWKLSSKCLKSFKNNSSKY